MGLWSKEHAMTLLPAVAVMILLGVILRRLLKNKDESVRMLPIQIIAVALVVLEIGKQAVSAANGYDLYALPFHFCSLALFTLPVMAFYRGKHAHAVRSITTAVCASITLLLLIYPCLIYSADNINNYFGSYADFHTVTFHNLVVLAFVLILVLEVHIPQGGAVKPLVVFILCFCLVSAFMAVALETNYANYYECNVPVFEAIRVDMQPVLGVWGAQLLYISIVSLLNVGFVLLSYGLYRLLRRVLPGQTAGVC